MNYEVKKLFELRKGRYLPCGLNIIEKLWWRFVPGITVKVKWPTGFIVVDHNDSRWIDLGGAVLVKLESADPNDFYRPWLEQNIGKQKWDWDWGFVGNDVSDNCLTIKVRSKHAKYATIIAMMWR